MINLVRKLFICCCVLFLVCLQNISAQTMANNSELLETGSFSKYHGQPSGEIKIVSYNIRWRSGESLEKIIELLRNDPEIGKADIICLQEVDRQRKRSGLTNTARVIAQSLEWNYAWAAPALPPDKATDPDNEESTGVAIFSPYPMSDPERLVLPNPGPGGRGKVGLGVTLRLGDNSFRVYSVHAETRISVDKKMEQLKTVIVAASSHKVEKVLIMGDFNTIKPKDVKACVELFTSSGFDTSIPHNQSTFKVIAFFKLKLDWIWVKGVAMGEGGIAKHISISDHKPLWMKIRL